MKAPHSFLWHDYETFGAIPMVDRPSQFAAIRTDANLDPIGEPLVWYCRPTDDYLPHPEACLITGITPDVAARKGLCEAEFARAIHSEMMEPGTCAAGYNSLRFDDEISRHLFYRNFFDAYEREWRNGNTRWDVIDLARMCYALRPAGIEWPKREDGAPSFRLEDLTAANGIEHVGAHDALADVRATINLARLLRKAQPRLFEWALGLRDQKASQRLLDPAVPRPVLHTSPKIHASRGCTTLVLPICMHPEQKKVRIVFDLMADPAPLLELDAGDIADRVFTPSADLPEGVERLPLKQVRTNRVPMLAPEGVLRGVDIDRIGLDPERCEKHAERILAAMDSIRYKVMDVFTRVYDDAAIDPDVALYGGGFFSDADRSRMTAIRSSSPTELAEKEWGFQDPRLCEMLFRYRARNWPGTLSGAETAKWEDHRKARLTTPPDDRMLGIEGFFRALAAARARHLEEPKAQGVLDHLEAWATDLVAPLVDASPGEFRRA